LEEGVLQKVTVLVAVGFSRRALPFAPVKAGGYQEECWMRWIIVLSMSILAGCQGSKPSDAKDAQSRIAAAKQIGNPSQRDEALAEACRGAAHVGAGEAVLDGLMAIGNPTLRDEVAVDSAQYLRMANQREAAVEVAKRIGNPTNTTARF
jgi:hypothetical protein